MTDINEKVAEMHGDVKVIMAEVKHIKEWIIKHEESDNEHFTKIHNKLNGLNKLVASVSAVAVIAGFVVGKFNVLF